MPAIRMCSVRSLRSEYDQFIPCMKVKAAELDTSRLRRHESHLQRQPPTKPGRMVQPKVVCISYTSQPISPPSSIDVDAPCAPCHHTLDPPPPREHVRRDPVRAREAAVVALVDARRRERRCGAQEERSQREQLGWLGQQNVVRALHLLRDRLALVVVGTPAGVGARVRGGRWFGIGQPILQLHI